MAIGVFKIEKADVCEEEKEEDKEEGTVENELDIPNNDKGK